MGQNLSAAHATDTDISDPQLLRMLSILLGQSEIYVGKMLDDIDCLELQKLLDHTMRMGGLHEIYFFFRGKKYSLREITKNHDFMKTLPAEKAALLESYALILSFSG